MNIPDQVYNEALKKVIEANPKKTLEIAEVKTQIIDSVLGFAKGTHPKTYNVLSIGCNLVTMGLAQRGHNVKAILCTDVCEDVYTSTFKDLNITIDKGEDGLEREVANGNTYDVVLGLDQILTYFNTEEEQKQFIGMISKVTKGRFITSLVDYKNQSSQSRMSDLPLTININGKQNLFINHRSWGLMDRQTYINHWLHLEESKLVNSCTTPRRTMFFKQLAKFSSDAGSKGFTIHKSVFYKPLINKTFEHVISINYE